jgi:hypothetical protein
VTVKTGPHATKTVIPFVGPDISPQISHSVPAILNAVNNNEWLKQDGCSKGPNYGCFGYLRVHDRLVRA